MIANQTNRPSGMPCPECRFFIQISLEDLLYKQSFKCPSCLLEITMDRSNSQEALKLLQDVKIAMDEVKQASRFNL